jgi:hypothetical protein
MKNRHVESKVTNTHTPEELICPDFSFVPFIASRLLKDLE